MTSASEHKPARVPVIGVMGSGADSHPVRAAAIGGWIAENGFHLLNGGGGGVMASVSRAFFEHSPRAGRVIGVLPCLPEHHPPDAPLGYPNPWVEIPIRTHLPLSGTHGTEAMSRNHINVLSADVIVALPGGQGTLSEVKLALEYRRPVIAYLIDPSEIPGLPEAVTVTSELDGVAEFVLKHLVR